MDTALPKMENKDQNVTKGRFASTSNEQKEVLMEKKNAKDTNRATKASLTALNEYIIEKQLASLDDMKDEDIPTLLENFYCDAHTKSNECYGTGSFKSMRSNLNRYLRRKEELTSLLTVDL